MNDKKITKLNTGYYLLEKGDKKLEISEHDLIMLKEGYLIVDWDYDPTLRVKEVKKYLERLRSEQDYTIKQAQSKLFDTTKKEKYVDNSKITEGIDF